MQHWIDDDAPDLPLEQGESEELRAIDLDESGAQQANQAAGR